MMTVLWWLGAIVAIGAVGLIVYIIVDFAIWMKYGDH